MSKEITAAEFLSGQEILKSVIGQGLNDQQQVENGISILSEDVTIVFANGSSRKFYVSDKFSVDFIYGEVKSDSHFLRTGTRLRPIYSPPSGFIPIKGEKPTHSTIYVYDLKALISGKALLPFYLYLNESGGRNGHVKVLARNTQIRIGDHDYIDFKKDKCTVDEVLSICADYNSKTDLHIVSDRRTTAKGYLCRKTDGYLVYNLLDILMSKATLPIDTFASYERITNDICIKFNNKQYFFKKGELTSVVEFWKLSLSNKNTEAYGYLPGFGEPLTFRLADVMQGVASLPAIGGYILSSDVIIQFEDKSEKIFEAGVSFIEMLSDLHKLHNMARTESDGYPNPLGGRITRRVRVAEKVKSVENSERKMSDDLLLCYADHVESVVVLGGITTEYDVTERINKSIKESEEMRQKIFFRRNK